MKKTWGTTACGLRKGRIFCKGQPKLLRFRGNDGFRLFEKNPAFRKRLPRKKTVKTDRFEKGKTDRKERAETRRREKLLLKRETFARKEKERADGLFRRRTEGEQNFRTSKAPHETLLRRSGNGFCIGKYPKQQAFLVILLIWGDMMAEEAINNNSSVQEQWGQICSQLKVEVGETAFDSWLKPLTPGAFNDGIMNICVPTRFMRNWVITHYSDRIHKIWEKKNPAIKSVNFVVQAVQDESKGLYNPSCRSLLKKISSSPAPQNIYQSGLNSVLANSNEFQANTDQSLSVPLNPQYTFDNFVVGKTNEFAYAAARKVAESRNVSFNPLFLYSGVGLGKTHLMHAIAWHIKQQDPTRNIVYLSAEKFMYKFVRALRYKDTTAFKEQFRSVDVLMVDDVQFMGGKDTTQEEFFYTFNSLIEEGRQIIISADKSPADLEGIEARLKSRLGCGLVADIHPTDFDLRIGILENKARQLGIELPQKVSEFLASKITSNIRELEGALRRVIAHSQLLSDKEITLDMTQDVLKDMLRSYDKRTTIDEIQKKVAEHFNISVKEMQSSRRARTVARPRQIAMYLAKQLTSRSLPEIGRKFDRDHTTVMHAVRKVEELILEDASLAENVDALRRILEA